MLSFAFFLVRSDSVFIYLKFWKLEFDI